MFDQRVGSKKPFVIYPNQEMDRSPKRNQPKAFDPDSVPVGEPFVEMEMNYVEPEKDLGVKERDRRLRDRFEQSE